MQSPDAPSQQAFVKTIQYPQQNRMPKKAKSLIRNESAWVSGIANDDDAIFRSCKEAGLLSFEILDPKKLSAPVKVRKPRPIESLPEDFDSDGDFEFLDEDYDAPDISGKESGKQANTKTLAKETKKAKTKKAKSQTKAKAANENTQPKSQTDPESTQEIGADSTEPVTSTQNKSGSDAATSNGGKTKKNKNKKKREHKNSAAKEPATKKPKIDTSKEKGAETVLSEEKQAEAADDKVDQEADDIESLDFSGWSNFNLHPTLMRGIQQLRFTNPTPIQRASLEAAMVHQVDIVGAAETGSGKTLAFGIPIVNHLLNHPEVASDTSDKFLPALIIAPTRELALQIVDHIQVAAKFTNFKIIAIVGGISPEKQERLLSKKPDVVVATPGRLWELIENGEPYLSRLDGLRFFVLDEADRMVSAGHFKELDHILNMIPSYSKREEDNFHREDQHTYIGLDKQTRRQTFVFSATLTMGNKGREERRSRNTKDPLDELLKRVDFQRKTRLIQLVPKQIVVERIAQNYITCTEAEKDYHLVYLLSTLPGKKVVFCNSIDCVLRLYHIVPLLRFTVVALHAQMQQRQRLKHLEKFVKNENATLIATDVAARGLDIKDIKYVIHYQLPRSAEIYVHRSGRTARAMTAGQSIMLVSPEEQTLFRKITSSLQQDGDVEEYSVNQSIFPSICRRVNKARLLDKELHKDRKEKASDDWLIKAAQEMEIELDDEFTPLKSNKFADGEERELATLKREKEITMLKRQLDEELNKPLVPKGVSKKYLTEPTTMGLASLLASTENQGESQPQQSQKKKSKKPKKARK